MPDAGIFYCSNCTDNVRRTFESGQVVTMTEDKFWENPDIIQEIFIKLWGYSDMMPKRLNLKSYLYSMVRNRVFNFMRDNRTRLVSSEEKLSDHLYYYHRFTHAFGIVYEEEEEAMRS